MNAQNTYRLLNFLPAALLAVAAGTVGWMLFAGEHVHFVRPAALLLGVSLPWLWWVSRRSLGGLGRWTHAFVVLLRLVIVGLLVCAAAELQGKRASDHLVVYYVLDHSASIPADSTAQGELFDYMKKQAEKRQERDQVGLIVFGHDVSIEYPPTDKPFEIRRIHAFVNRDYTDIGGAIQLAASAFPRDARKRIVLFSDGNENVGNADEEAQNAAAQGVAIDVYPIRYEIENEIWVDKLILPSEVKVGETFNVTVVISSTIDTQARLLLYEAGRPIVPPGAQGDRAEAGFLVDLKAGRKNVFVIQRKLSTPTFYQYEAKIKPLRAAHDTRPENNVGYAFTWVKGKARVLILARSERDVDQLRAAIQDEEIYVEVRGENEIPVSDHEINSYDCIILANVGKGAFTDENHMQLFESAVKHAGLGLVMIGGEDSFGAGGYSGTPIERALPVDMEIKMRKIMPNGALVLILHTSEFFRGNAWAKKITKAAIRVLSDQDLVGVLLYDGRRGGSVWLFPLTPAAQRRQLYTRIDGAAPGDMPDFGTTMKMAYKALKNANAALKHCIIISDGDPSMPSKQLLQQFRAGGITISTIGIAPHSPGDVNSLKIIASATRGRFYYAKNPRELPQIFIKEAAVVRRSLIANETFTPILKNVTEPIKGFAAGEFPPLLAFVVTELKQRAEEPLRAIYRGEESPLLAHWQYGLGRGVAFTSDATGNWGKHWVDWEKFSKFWTQTIRWATRKRPRSDLEITTRIVGGDGRVQVEAFGDDGEPLDGLDFRGFVKWPKARYAGEGSEARAGGQSFELQQVAPGRYEGRFDAADVGTYLVSVSYPQADGRPVAETSGVSVSYSPEYNTTGPNMALLQKIADAGKYGRLLDGGEDDNVFRHDLPASMTTLPLWRTLLWTAVALFLLDIFLRRVLIDWGKISEKFLMLGALVIPRLRERLARIVRADADPVQAALAAKRADLVGADAERKAALLDALTEAEPYDEEQAAAAGAAASTPVPGRKAPAKKEKTAASAYTSRLLQAKKQALDERKRKK